MDDILTPLNDKQREAVTATEGPYLILAGPGSGKTRVITHRFAYILKTKNIDPSHILAVTFTNKAANEMKERIQKLTHLSLNGLWIRTFHSMAYRILREYARLLGYAREWETIDEDDALKIIRKVSKRDNHFSKLYKPESLLFLISKAKEEFKPIIEVTGKRILSNEEASFLHEVFSSYQEYLRRTHLMDYSDLLVNTYLLFKDYPDVLDAYQNQWQYIMVDEFQDTNALQYNIIALLAEKHKNIMIVGDDDQSIYGWRGARVTNMRLFKEHFHATTIKLEQNYRSTQMIIQAANKIAEYIDDRMGKTLWTENKEGEPITIMYGGNEYLLYESVVRKIKGLKHLGYSYRDIAIFYRINAQSQSIEDLLIKHQVPYHIVGSLRFFERKEIKDVLAYVAFLINPWNVVAFERLIEVPQRGIGEATVEKILTYAQAKQCDLLTAMHHAPTIHGLGSKAIILQKLAMGFSELREDISSLSPSTFLRILVDMIPFEQYWTEQKEIERWENIQALVNAARVFEDTNPNSTIADFLTYANLNSTEEHIKETDYVTLMTMHNAKGLEFRVVFVLGVVNGLIPLSRNTESRWGENEEKRLFYVAVTRAKEKLFLCVPSSQYAFGESVSTTPSPYLSYIPKECLEEEHVASSGFLSSTPYHPIARGKNTLLEETSSQRSSSSSPKKPFSPGKPATFQDLQPGVRIRHRLLGEGEVVKIVGQRVMIRFESGAVQLLDGNFLSSVEIL
ncbi:MAG: UvrD-helicase domain-containing protein [Brevinematales bacterium]|nr:UvrD-helicase domain-containing protein [Brevinematales bacterium]